MAKERGESFDRHDKEEVVWWERGGGREVRR